jgi:hypothetical protein
MKPVEKAHERTGGRGNGGWCFIGEVSEALGLFPCLEGDVVGQDHAVFCCVSVPQC